MRAANTFILPGSLVLMLSAVTSGCGKLEQKDPSAPAKARVEAKRQQRACSSAIAYDRIKALVFDRAIAAHRGDRDNLDTLSDYSIVRMEQPVVAGSDPEVDLTRCKGRLILELPPGAERGLGGERRLQQDVDYTAQAAADGNGLVYRLNGAETIVAKLAAFSVPKGAYRPPPAIDEDQAAQDTSDAVAVARDASSQGQPEATIVPPAASTPAPRPRRRHDAPELAEPEIVRAASAADDRLGDGDGEATVRAFYTALGRGDGVAASAQVVPEKQSSRAFSPDAITRFYGRLPEPIRLVQIVPLDRGAYRVRYRYAAGRSRCNGSAIARITNRGGREYIRSIDALSGC